MRLTFCVAALSALLVSIALLNSSTYGRANVLI